VTFILFTFTFTHGKEAELAGRSILRFIEKKRKEKKRKESCFTEYRTPDRPSRSLVNVSHANPAIIRYAEDNFFLFPSQPTTFRSHRIPFTTE
jgi:hypothetical protein